ncbi:MAG TPA: protein translocase subunit SecF [Sphingomicrobium sp.]|jgi:preprotein translocase subunit SecF|nr:protein translocase subunit SecF [Sphingomicrobium sp.]
MKLLKLVPEGTNIDFMRWRNFALILSIIVSVASVAYAAYAGLNLGIDFVGGEVVRVEFAKPVPIEDLRARIDRLGVGEASPTALGKDNRTYQIRLPKPPGPETESNAEVSKLRTAIPQEYPGARVDAGESVSGKVSEELAGNSALAIGFAMLGISIYIWFRFEWQFGVGALVGLAHDVAMTLGFFAFTRLPVDLNVVAAFLTIVGYSLNDTVVIYDRIRENLRKYRKMSIIPLINLSLNETLARTVVTSLTVLLALGVLMLIGPEVIFGLAVAIFLGVVIGTYSSIYISSPVLVWLGIQPDSFLKSDEKDTPQGQTA